MRAPARLALGVAGLALLSGCGFLALTSFAPGSWVAAWAPCPRNWGWAPAWQPRRSPLRSTSFQIMTGQAKVCYGSPSLRGRTMIGGEAVPFGKLWRLGANEPTTIHVNRPFHLAGLDLDAGSYALYAIPGPDSWEIVVNRSIRQWGVESEYTAAVEAEEAGRFEVPVETLAQPVESLTVRAEVEPEGLSGVSDLIIEWQTSRVRLRLVE